MTSPSTPKPYPEDYNRDYYPALKADFANDPTVRIYSKDDYTIDPLDTPWLSENRARSLPEIRANLSAAPPSAEELPLTPRPLRPADLHTAAEIASFEPRMRTADAVSGRVWRDPMPESDFERDENWIDMRRVDEEFDDGEAFFASLDVKPRKGRVYESLEEERRAVKESADRMQAENLDRPGVSVAWDETVPVPEEDEFRRWQREAELRGGNSSMHDSFFLSPARAGGPVPGVGEGAAVPDEGTCGPPKQFEALSDAHVGKWCGRVYVLAVSSGKEFGVRVERCMEVRSEVSVCGGGDLEWSAVVADDCAESVSEITLPCPECKEALVPGRGVWADGSYVMQAHSTDGNGSGNDLAGLSVSTKCLRTITGDLRIKGELELCMVSKDGHGDIRRDRVLLCVSSKPIDAGTGDQKRQDSFSFVVLISETLDKGEAGSSVLLQNPPHKLQSTASRLLTGSWSGTGGILHPEFPPYSYREIKTKFSFLPAAQITEQDVIWVENEIPDKPGMPARGRQRTLAKKKVSKRVAAARDYDRKRLAECSFLSREEAGEETLPETFAWKAIPSKEEFTCLFSPRIGRFPDDYCGIVLPGASLLTFPYAKAYPSMWNTVTLTELQTPARKKITAGRNEDGVLVGVLFVSETIADSELCDEVASYV